MQLGARSVCQQPAASVRGAAASSLSSLTSCGVEVNTPAQNEKALLRGAKVAAPTPKLLARIEQLRLLSRVEESGLLSAGAALVFPRDGQAGATGYLPWGSRRSTHPASNPCTEGNFSRETPFLCRLSHTRRIHLHPWPGFLLSTHFSQVLTFRAADKAGFSLSKIESLGLLSKAESLGALSLATDRNTPRALSGAALALLTTAAGIVALVPADGSLFAAKVAGAALLASAALGALVGASILGSLQE